MADYEIFREQLAIKYPSYGYALWEPSPTNPNRPVQVGDVGFIREGRFYCLFSALRPADDPYQEFGVPECHERLVPTLRGHVTTVPLGRNNYCSPGVIVEADPGYHSRSDDFPQILYRNETTRAAAVLSLPLTARRENTLIQNVFGSWIVKHIDTWFAFGRNLGLVHRMEDIILVTGCDLARSWTNVAFLGGWADAQVSFGVSVEGPTNTGINFQFSPEHARGAVLHHGPEGTNLPENQCVFVRGFRVASSLWILPKRLKAAAGPSSGPGGYDCDSDVEVISMPAIGKFRDPLNLLIDYIAEQASDCDKILVHDDDLLMVNGIGSDAQASLETLEPDVMVDLLRKSDIKIKIHKFGCDSFLTENQSGLNADTSNVNVATLSTKFQNWMASGRSSQPIHSSQRGAESQSREAELQAGKSESKAEDGEARGNLVESRYTTARTLEDEARTEDTVHFFGQACQSAETENLEVDAKTMEASVQTIQVDTQCKEEELRHRESEVVRLEERVQQALEEVKRLESAARQAEVSAKMHEASAQKKETEARSMEAECRKVEADVRDREAKVRLREEEVSKNEEKLRVEMEIRKVAIREKEAGILIKDAEAEKYEAKALEIRMGELAIRKKETEISMKEAEARRREAKAVAWATEATRKEEEARQREADALRLEEKARQVLAEVHKLEAVFLQREAAAVRIREAKAKDLEIEMQSREAEMRWREDEARKKEDAVRHLEERAQQSLEEAKNLDTRVRHVETEPNMREILVIQKRGLEAMSKRNEAIVSFHAATEEGDIDALKSLLERGVDINARDAHRRTPLDKAASNGNADVVRFLIERGAEVVSYDEDSEGWTPLHDSSLFGHLEVSRVLLDHGANVNARNWDYGTPMHVSAGNGYLEIVKLLLERGADLRATNASGETPYGVSLRTGNREIADLLRKSDVGSLEEWFDGLERKYLH